MKLSPLLKKEYILGLDIGASSIKSALFRKNQDSLLLIGLKMIEVIPERQTLAALKGALSGIDVKKLEVITVLNSAQTMVKRIAVPPMPKEELKEALSLEAKNYFPFPVDDSQLDFEIVGEITEKGLKKTELLLAVCPKSLIREHLDLLRQAGLRPSCIIHPSLALRNLLRAKKLKESFSVAALDIGKGLCELLIVKDDKLTFTRKIPVCGDDFTKALTSTLFSSQGKVQLSYEEAERIKKDHGLPPEAGPELIENKITAAQLISLLRPQAEKLSSEIERSFDFYREETGGSKVERLILSGGGAGLRGLDKFLSAELGIEVEVYGSLEGISPKEGAISQGAQIYALAACAGAGLNKTGGINFLPLEVKQETIRSVQKATFKAVFSAAITIMALVFIGMRIQLANLDKMISAAKFELSALRQQFGEPGDWFLMSKILKDEPYCEDLLKEISNVIPPGVCLKEINMQKGTCSIKGVILSSGNPEEILSAFIHPLERGMFKNPRSVTIQEGAGAKEFEFQVETK